MNRRRNLWISMIAAVLSAGLVYGVYILQLRQVQLQQTIRVAVPKQFIAAGKLLDAGMFELKPMFIAAYNDNMFTDPSKLQGMEALMPLGEGEPVLSWKLGKFNLIPREGQATFQVPKSYILSISDGIRAGDKVLLYISDPSGKSRRLFDQEITVASVKSSGHTEVDDSQNSRVYALAEDNKEKMYASRLNGTADIQEIDLNLQEPQWLAIDQLCKTGRDKLVIANTASTYIGAAGIKPQPDRR